MNTNIIISICALVVSLAAIILTLVQIKIQREHNFKSIKPIGQINVADYEADVHVAISNAGIGPLIIKSVRVFNTQRQSTNLLNILPDDLVNTMIWTDFVVELEGRAVNVGESVYLIRAMFDDDENLTRDLIDFRTRLRTCLGQITIELTYTDVYEKNTYNCSRQLSWFARH